MNFYKEINFSKISQTLTPSFGYEWRHVKHERKRHATHFWSEGLRAEYVACVDIGPFLVRRTDFESMGGFDEGFSFPGQGGVGFDYEMSLRAWYFGKSVALYDLVGSGIKWDWADLVDPRPLENDNDNGVRKKAIHGADKGFEVRRHTNERMMSFRTEWDLIIGAYLLNFYCNILLVISK